MPNCMQKLSELHYRATEILERDESSQVFDTEGVWHQEAYELLELLPLMQEIQALRDKHKRNLEPPKDYTIYTERDGIENQDTFNIS